MGLVRGDSDPGAWGEHPEHLETEELHDPAQAWNAITVGASTDRWRVTEEDYDGWEPVAQAGDLSPSTSTSMTWQTPWPLKPDVVAEGGNAARSSDGRLIDRPDSLRLLTAHHEPSVRLLTPCGDTSGASALVAHMAAELRRQYPDLWPETIRALIVHSARWTSTMHERYRPSVAKGDYERLVRRCGFGVPSLDRALWSAGNRLTLIAEESIQPFVRKPGRSPARRGLPGLRVVEGEVLRGPLAPGREVRARGLDPLPGGRGRSLHAGADPGGDSHRDLGALSNPLEPPVSFGSTPGTGGRSSVLPVR